ncbi:hypothetical protein RUM44_007929 [Polyplax serrata]|uniref:Uncharacterized protein n=1 Tax=Polyplax serrata TaxID=468196 RepID=A0ABR1B8Q2_POLSC
MEDERMQGEKGQKRQDGKKEERKVKKKDKEGERMRKDLAILSVEVSTLNLSCGCCVLPLVGSSHRFPRTVKKLCFLWAKTEPQICQEKRKGPGRNFVGRVDRTKSRQT